MLARETIARLFRSFSISQRLILILQAFYFILQHREMKAKFLDDLKYDQEVH